VGNPEGTAALKGDVPQHVDDILHFEQGEIRGKLLEFLPAVVEAVVVPGQVRVGINQIRHDVHGVGAYRRLEGDVDFVAPALVGAVVVAVGAQLPLHRNHHGLDRTVGHVRHRVVVGGHGRQDVRPVVLLERLHGQHRAGHDAGDVGDCFRRFHLDRLAAFLPENAKPGARGRQLTDADAWHVDARLRRAHQTAYRTHDAGRRAAVDSAASAVVQSIVAQAVDAGGKPVAERAAGNLLRYVVGLVVDTARLR